MNPSFHVFLKEGREMLRDKRVVQSALFGPVFLVIMFVMLFGFLQSTVGKKEGQKIHFVKVSPEPSLLKDLREQSKANLIEVASAKAGEEMVRKGDAKVVLVFPADFDAAIARGELARFKAIFDKEQPSSQIALAKVQERALAQGKIITASALAKHNLPVALANPILIDPQPVERKGGGMGGFLAGMMPYLIVIWAFYGGFSQASDLVAGEKERSTLETLFISPVSRLKIALGKFYSLTTLCFVSSVSSLVAVIVTASLPMAMTKKLFENGVQLTALGVFSILTVIIPLSMMFAGILLAVSAYARNTREAQSHLTLVSFIVLMPAIFSQVIGYTDFAKALWVSFVPILNSASVLRSAMLGNFELVPFLVTLGVNLVLAAIALRLVVMMFGKERVLWRI
ncbi:MAG: ABC transporter permease [Armatimonadetes bacterium]|nr:ABC transporter permease [Armatimonadota bacterium]